MLKNIQRRSHLARSASLEKWRMVQTMMKNQAEGLDAEEGHKTTLKKIYAQSQQSIKTKRSNSGKKCEACYQDNHLYKWKETSLRGSDAPRWNLTWMIMYQECGKGAVFIEYGCLGRSSFPTLHHEILFSILRVVTEKCKERM